MARGDRISVERRFLGSLVRYRHLGIDLGDGTVVHARPDDFRRPFSGGRIERTTIAEFAAGGEVSLVSDPPAAHPPEEIAGRALAAVGEEGYCPLAANCEHFATWCATGRSRSRQVEAAVAVAAVVAVWAGSAVARIALGGDRSQTA